MAALDNSGSVPALLDIWGEEMSTPRFDKAYKDCLDDAGKITRLEPLYRLCEVMESENQEAKVLLFKLADEMERDGYETLPKAAKAWLGSNDQAL